MLAGAPLAGLIHGLLVTRLGLQPFLVTLCGLFIYRGAARWLSKTTVGLAVGAPPAFGEQVQALVDVLVKGRTLGVPHILWLTLALTVSCVPLLLHARQCRYYVLVPLLNLLIIDAYLHSLKEAKLRYAIWLVVWVTVLVNSFFPGAFLLALGLLPGALRQSGAHLFATPSAMVLAAGFGWSLGALLIPAFTVLQERTDEATRGRIFGGIFTVINAAVAAPLVLAGGLADGFGVARVVSVLGGALLLTGAVAGLLFRDRLRVLDVAPRGC